MEERIMKKCFSNIRTLAALLMAGAFAACSSDDNSIEQPANPTAPKTYTLTVNASKGDASTRALALNGTKLVAKWADGDELYVYKATNRAECTSDNKLGTISTVSSAISADGAKATFKGNLSGTVSNGDKLMLVYHPTAFAIAGFEGQAGTLASASNLDCATALVTTASVSGSDITISETSATFTTHTAMLKLTLTTNGTTTINPKPLKMSMSALGATLKEFTFSPTDATYTANGNGVLYFALPSVEDVIAGLALESKIVNKEQLAGATITYTATVGSDVYTATKTGYTFAAGKYYAGTLTMAPEGAINGRFSVSDTKKVYFSKGNLQATYDGSNWTWAFAANQWDYIGNAAGNTKVTASSPYISENATVDLFGWVGASSNWAGVNKYGITSSSATNNKNGYGNVASESLKSDWGALIGLGWRTLSMAEWTYLLATRTVNGGKGADKSYTLNQSVNGKKGMVIYPDNYTGAVYSGDNWASFEAAGCVFLPAAGWRDGTTIKNSINDRGYYWSTTPSNATDAKRMFFAGGLELTGYNSRAFGFSVRLVREVE